MNSSGVPAYQAQASAINQTLAALPLPLLDLAQGTAAQAQALALYQNATTWKL